MNKIVKHIVVSAVLGLVFMNAHAQFISAIVGVDGLTCSACSFSTEKSIRKLAFVDSVFMELDKNLATVYFKKNMPVSIKVLAQKVFDAGFAVRNVDAVFHFNDLTVNENTCFDFENNTYQFVKIDSEKKINGISTMRFIGEKFMSKKEYKNWKFLTFTCKTPLPISEQYLVTIR